VRLLQPPIPQREKEEPENTAAEEAESPTATDVAKLLDQLDQMTVLEPVEPQDAPDEQPRVTAAAPLAAAAGSGRAPARGDGAGGWLRAALPASSVSR